MTAAAAAAVRNIYFNLRCRGWFRLPMVVTAAGAGNSRELSAPQQQAVVVCVLLSVLQIAAHVVGGAFDSQLGDGLHCTRAAVIYLDTISSPAAAAAAAAAAVAAAGVHQPAQGAGCPC
jgi:hypothetical protein